MSIQLPDSKPRDERQAGRSVAHQTPARLPYSRPELTLLGDLRSATLAPTPRPEYESGPGLGYRSF